MKPALAAVWAAGLAAGAWWVITYPWVGALLTAVAVAGLVAAVARLVRTPRPAEPTFAEVAALEVDAGAEEAALR